MTLATWVAWRSDNTTELQSGPVCGLDFKSAYTFVDDTRSYFHYKR